MNKTRVWTAFKKGVNALMNNPGCLRKILNMSMLSGFFDKRIKTIKRYDGETVSGDAKKWGQVTKGKDKKMKEYLIPPIDEHKKKTLSYNEIEFLIKRITDVVNKSPDGKKLEEEIEKAKGMFSITSVMSLVRGGLSKWEMNI